MDRLLEGGSCQPLPSPASAALQARSSGARHGPPGSLLPGPLPSGLIQPRHSSLPTLLVLGSSLRLGCWRRKVRTSAGGSPMVGDAYLTTLSPRGAERRPGRKRISRSRKFSKMAAVIAWAVLRRPMTRWPQWACAGPVSAGLGKILPKKRDREDHSQED